MAAALKENQNPAKEREATHMSLKNTRVLVVEDNHLNRFVAKKLLANLGAEVQLAMDGKEAVAMIQRTDFDIVFMDIEMPEMNGYEATKRIREELQLSKRKLPVVAMTAHASKEVIKRCRSEDMNGYISKSFNTDNLHKTAQKVISEAKKK